MEKLSLNKCKAILEKGGKKYTDEEIIKIRDLLYKLAQLDIELFREIKKGTKK